MSDKPEDLGDAIRIFKRSGFLVRFRFSLGQIHGPAARALPVRPPRFLRSRGSLTAGKYCHALRTNGETRSLQRVGHSTELSCLTACDG